MEIKVTLDDHPTKAVVKGGPNKGEAITKDGKPVPLITDQHAIRLNGIMVGYCMKKPGGWIAIIDHNMEESVKTIVVDEVKKLRGDETEPTVSQVPIVPLDDENEEEESDEDE